MIYYNSHTNYWSAAEHDLLVVPVDCSGSPQRGPLTVLDMRLEGLTDQYVRLAKGNHLTTGIVKFDWRGANKNVKFVVFLPLAPNANTFHSFKAWVDCMEDLSAKMNVLATVNSLGMPHIPELGDWEKQEDVILDLFGGIGENHVDLTLYGGRGTVGEDELTSEEIEVVFV